MTTFCHDILLLKTFFRQFEYLFRINFFFLLRLLFFFRLFFIGIAERESEVFLPVAGLFFFQFVLVHFSQNDNLAADSCQQFLFVFGIMQFTQFFNHGIFRTDFLFFEKFAKDFFTKLLVYFAFFAQNSGYFGTGTGGCCKHLPLRLYTLRFRCQNLHLVATL